MGVEIICPLYKAEKYIENLNKALLNQKNIKLDKITYVLTKSNDSSEDLLKKISANYFVIEQKDFSHSLTREKYAKQSQSDIIVFITQDIEIEREDWLFELVKPIINEEAEASFSKQISKFNNIEKYTREKNYPEKSYIVDKNSIDSFGLQTFFFSDASSAIKRKIFEKLNWYDEKNLPTNEDQYIAYKLIMNGYRIKYCANSIVYHSHNFTLAELYKRYYNTGLFYKKENYLDKYGTNKSGGELAMYIFKRAIQDRNWKVLLRYLPDMLVRFIGMKVGKLNG